MTAPDMDVIKEIPGYKVILKAVLKMQIQQLVENLASHTDEESVILTASVSDGTLSHLGSDSGKFFLDDHEDIKSQFLGFCLKRHHKRKQQEKEQKEALEKEQREALMSPLKMGGPQMRYPDGPRYGSPRMPMRSPRYPSQGVHPVSLTRSPHGAQMRSPGPRHQPYPMARPPRRPSFDQPGTSAMKLPLGSKIDNQIIKIEPDIDSPNGDDNPPKPSESANEPNSSQPPSPSNLAETSQSAADKDDEATNSSTSTIPNEQSDLKFSDTQPAEGLSLDSDLSNLITSETNAPSTSDTPGSVQGSDSGDPNVNIKLEAISESEMDLEITGVELGHGGPMRSPENWNQPGGAMGSPSDMQGAAQGYTPDMTLGGDFTCEECGRSFSNKTYVKRHQAIVHRHEKPFECKICGKSFSTKNNMKTHMIVHFKMHNK